MTERERLLQSIATLTWDYRSKEILRPTPQHVDRWVSQFAIDVQQPILAEMEHVLHRTYFPESAVRTFLSRLVINKDLAGQDPCAFWKGVRFLNIQGGGNSQREMLVLFSDELQKHCGITVEQCGTEPKSYLYLDDVIFTGGRIKNDLINWIVAAAPKQATVNVVTIGLHALGQWHAKKEIADAANSAGKQISLHWWRAIQIEDRKRYIDSSDVLRPTSIPRDAATQAYVQSLNHPPVLRQPGNIGGKAFFSSEQGRSLLEQEFLKIGVHIRSICPQLGRYQRPLGNMVLNTTGFGSLIVTFRNCPNNAPLALWAGAPWYPLFLRKTN